MSYHHIQEEKIQAQKYDLLQILRVLDETYREEDDDMCFQAAYPDLEPLYLAGDEISLQSSQGSQSCSSHVSFYDLIQENITSNQITNYGSPRETAEQLQSSFDYKDYLIYEIGPKWTTIEDNKRSQTLKKEKSNNSKKKPRSRRRRFAKKATYC